MRYSVAPLYKPLLAVLAASTAIAGSSPVEPKPPGVSSQLFGSLERLARLVDISYCIGTTGVQKPFSCASRCKEFPEIELVSTWSTGMFLTDSCGYIAIDHGPKDGRIHDPATLDNKDGAIVVAFRGTYSIANTIIDLSTMPQKYAPYPSPDDGGNEPDVPQHRCDNCTVHSGFLKAWQSARDEVIPQLQSLQEQYPFYPVHFVGHSLGGAVACLAALEAKVSLGWEKTVVTTFGEPRLGNEDFVRYVDEVFDLNNEPGLEARAYRRVTHTNDPVPLLPPGEWGYKSHGGELFVTKSDLSPSEEDVQLCVGDADSNCSAGEDITQQNVVSQLPSFRPDSTSFTEFLETMTFPTRLKLWQLFFAHRDYFWRLGLCLPGGDPANWGREIPEPGFVSEEL